MTKPSITQNSRLNWDLVNLFSVEINDLDLLNFENLANPTILGQPVKALLPVFYIVLNLS